MKKIFILFFTFCICFLSSVTGVSSKQCESPTPAVQIKRMIYPTSSILSVESSTIAIVTPQHSPYIDLKYFISLESYVEIYYDTDTNYIKAFNMSIKWYMSSLVTGTSFNDLDLKETLINSVTKYSPINNTILLSDFVGARIYAAVDNVTSSLSSGTLSTTLRYTFQYNATTINWTDIDNNYTTNLLSYIDTDYFSGQGVSIIGVGNCSPGFVASNYSFQDFNYNSGYSDGYDKGKSAGYEIGFVEGQESSKWNDVFNVIKGIFSIVTDFLSVELFPNIKIIYIIAIPLVLAVVKWILDWVR